MKTKQPPTPINILLADDDADDRYLFDKALNGIHIGTQLTTVNDGEQLMEYLEKSSTQLPDIIFLDLSMPRKTGFECLSEINGNEKLKNLPVVIFSTSFTRGIDLERNLVITLSNMGAVDYIRKPGDFEELKMIIHKAIVKAMKKGSLIDEQKKINLTA